MTSDQIKDIERAYHAKFDNLDEVWHMSIFDQPEYNKLLQTAVERGTPLTRSEVEAVFGDPGWEW